MQNGNGRQAQSVNEQTEVMTFNFSESQSEIRNVFVNGEPHFVAIDIAKVLGYKNTRDAIRQHCRYVVKYDIPHPQSSEKQLEVSAIPESDVYRLIMSSTLPSAQKFERWVMEEVLPSIRKKGFYKVASQKNDFIDARDVPFHSTQINNYNVTTITIGDPVNETLYQVNDLHRAIQSTTSSAQVIKKLNAKQVLAWKIWIFGQTNPAWFTNELGKSLIFSGSVSLKGFKEMLYLFNQKEVYHDTSIISKSQRIL